MKKAIKILFTVVLFQEALCGSSQDTIITKMNSSDTLFFNFQYQYDTVITPPKYGNGNEINFFLIDKIIPILKNCTENNSYAQISAHFLITISEDGEVIKVETVQVNISRICECMLLAELNNMTKWIPAKVDGINVPSKILFPIILKL